MTQNSFENLYSNYVTKYPEIAKLIGIHPDQMDVDKFIDKYFTTEYVQDISVDPSSNVASKTMARAKVEAITPFFKKYTFKELYNKMVELYGINDAKQLLSNLWNGVLYLHDSSFLGCYCLGADFLRLIIEGMPYGQEPSLPPKHARTFLSQAAEAVIELSNEFAGAIAPSTLILLYSYMLLKENKSEVDLEKLKPDIVNDFQRFVHTINKELRNGIQSCFLNLSFFDRYILSSLVEVYYPFLADEVGNRNLINTTIKIQEYVMEFLCKGNPAKDNTVYRFPVLTAQLSIDKNKEIKDKKFFKLVCNNNTRGQMNIYIVKNTLKLSSCCRYISEYDPEANLKFDSFGNGGAINIGSLRVVTLNLNRIALESKGNKDTFIQNIKLYMDCAKYILDAFRECVRDKINAGVYRSFNLGWFDLDRMFFSTIGFIGFYEALQTLHSDIEDNFAVSILELMDKIIKVYNRHENGRVKYNLEEVPGESCAGTLAAIDKYFYGNNNTPYVMYSNQFIPLYIDHSVLDKIRVEGVFYPYLSGGGITHINISHELTDKQCADLIRLAVKNGIDHFALNPCFSLCENGHSVLGKVDVCPICNGKIKDYITRVVGFFVPVSSFSKTRREWEFPRRKWNGLK